jgi:invasion protein IalB
MKRTSGLFLSIATYLAFDGSALRAANDPRAAQLTYESWMKACIAATCFVSAGVRGACFPSGGGLSIIVTNQENMSLSAHFATRRVLEGPISVQIDQGDPVLIPHPECTEAVCGGKVQIGGDFIERLKRSQTITIEAMDTARQKNSLTVSLAGFAKAYDGAASGPPEVREEILSPEKYKEMVQREDERRKALECKD